MNMNHHTVAALIALQCERIRNAEKANNANTSFNVADARAQILFLEQNFLPHGSGIDSGCNTDMRMSGVDRVVLKVPYHAMDENGYYCGWFYYKAVIKMTFSGLSVSVTGGRKGDREYIRQAIANAIDLVPGTDELAPMYKAVYA